MELIRFWQPAVNYRESFDRACTLFNTGHLNSGTNEFRFCLANVSKSPSTSVEFVWCDRLPLSVTIFPGTVQFLYVEGKLLCFLQCEQLRANTMQLFGLCHAINLMIHARHAGIAYDYAVAFDVGDGSTNIVQPKISYCSANDFNALVFDPEFAFSNGYESVRLQSSKLPKWPDRLNSVIWRGSTTGQISKKPLEFYENSDWSWLQRLNLCDAVSRSVHKKHFDVGISQIVQLSGDAQRRASISTFKKPGLPMLAFGGYRYALDIDGNTNAWSGYFTKLLMGCCVIKVASPFNFRQWYYGELREWEHFVPVNNDLSNLDETIGRLLASPGMSEEIAANGSNAARAITMEWSLKRAVQVLEDPPKFSS